MSGHDVSVAGQVAVVSGGAGDIGQAVAEALSAAGARVALGDVQPKTSIGAGARRHHYTCVDVTDAEAIESWLDRVEAELGVPSLIIPNAAVVELGNALDTPVSAWRRTLDVNLTGAFLLARTAARRLVAARRAGRIVFIGSWAAHAPHPAIVAYSAAKAGLRMTMQCLALELAPHGILVNEVAPGRVDAGLSRRMFAETPGFREKAQAEIPLRTLLQPKEVADAVVWLCQPESRQITGSVLLVDGGVSLVRAV